jgi:hypothetical protein
VQGTDGGNELGRSFNRLLLECQDRHTGCRRSASVVSLLLSRLSGFLTASAADGQGKERNE